MRHYEIMIILDAGLEEDEIRATVDRATQLITAGGGTVSKVDRWGRRRFAYEVHHRSEGYYVVVDLEADTAAVAQVHRMLGLADEVIRHKVIKLPDEAVGRAVRPPDAEETPAAVPSANGAN